MRRLLAWFNGTPRHQHDHVEFHSFQSFVNTTVAHAICLTCSKPARFDLGYVADSDNSRNRAIEAVLRARGFTQDPQNFNTWIRTEGAP